MDKEEENVKHRINQKVSNIDIETLRKMLSMNTEIANHTSHSLLQTLCHNQPDDRHEAYQQNDDMENSVSCPVVLAYLHKRFREALFSEQEYLSRLFRPIPETATIAGYSWEPHGHTQFCRGGDFTLIQMTKGAGRQKNRLIQANESKTISIESMTLTVLDKSAVCQPGEYYISPSKNEPTFDACFLLNNELIALQFTISIKHTTKDNGFPTLISMRPTTCTEQSLVYVVPKGRAERFTCDAPSDRWLNTFNFYVLALDRKYCPS